MKPQHISRSLLATVFGRGMSGGLAFAVTPIYISFLGAEAYGLFGFYLLLFATATLLDQAVSSTVVRALARHPVTADDSRRFQDTLRTGEWISMTTAIVLGTSIAFAAPWLATTMIHAQHLPSDEVVISIRLIGLVTAVQWPTMLYGGALTGLGRLVELSLVRGVVALFQWGGGAVLLWLVAPRIELLFVWQAACSLGLVIGLRAMIRRNMPKTASRPRFSKSVVIASWQFGTGAFVIAVMGTVLTQADKLLISRLLPLTTFVAYSLAFTVASVISVFILGPAMSVAFPHFTRLHAEADFARLGMEYRRWTQVSVVFLAPATCVMVLAPTSLLQLWLGQNNAMVSQAALFLPLIAIGTMLNSIMLIPFNLQLASGWTSLSSKKNIIIVPIALVILWWGIPRYGAIVGAGTWFAINLSYYIVEVYLMHRRLLRDQMVQWWVNDTGVPITSTFTVFAALHWLVGRTSNPIVAVMWSALIAGAATIVLIILLPYPRALARDLLTRRVRASGR